MFNKKTISNVVATTFILAIAVISVVGFLTWNNNNLSNIFSNTEKETQDNLNKNNIELLKLDRDYLYVKSKYEDNLTKEILINNKPCVVNKNVSLGLNKFNVSDCILPDEKNFDITFITQINSFEKTFFVK